MCQVNCLFNHAAGLAVQLAFWPDADKKDLSKLPLEADQKEQQ